MDKEHLKYIKKLVDYLEKDVDNNCPSFLKEAKEILDSNKIISKYKGRKHGATNKRDKYKLEYNEKEYLCKSQQEIANITGRSRMCISRIIREDTTFRCNERTKDLRNIVITNLDTGKIYDNRLNININE